MTVNALSQLSRSQMERSGIDDDNLVYDIVVVHAMPNFNMKKKVAPLTIQSLLSTQKEDKNCS